MAIPTDAPPWTGRVELACGRSLLDEDGLEADQRHTTLVADEATCPDCCWIIRRDREAAAEVLPDHYFCRLPIGVSELARALKRVSRPGQAHKEFTCKPLKEKPIVSKRRRRPAR